MLVSEVLAKAADLIEPAGAWTQRAASDANGAPLRALDVNATCWCMWGAIAKTRGIEEVSGRYVRAAGCVLPGKPNTAYDIGRWNDAPGRTQAEVVAKLREAAALAKEQGK